MSAGALHPIQRLYRAEDLVLRRVAWFRDVLLEASHRLQILFTTCRPHELLRPEEMPDAAASRSSAGGRIHVIDLARVIRRHARYPAQGAPIADEAALRPR